MEQTFRRKCQSGVLSPVHKLLVLVVLLIGCCETALSANWEWKTEQVFPSGTFTNIAIDHVGGIHVGFMSSNGLVYAYRQGISGKWLLQVINQGGEWIGLALDSHGFPHFCFNTSGARLMYAFLNQSGWHSQQIAPGLGAVGYTCSVAVAPDGTVNLLWYQINNPAGDFYHLRHAELKNGAWLTRTVDMAAETGKWNSVTVDKTGTLQIAYSTFEDAELRHARFDGKEWVKGIVDSRIISKNAKHPFFGNSIAVKEDGTIQISYEDDDQLKFAVKKGDHWNIETLDSLSPKNVWWAFHTSQVIDQNGFAHVVYQDAGALKHAYQDQDGWHLQLLVPAGIDPFRFGNIALGPHNTLYVIYRDPNTTSVKLAIGTMISDNRGQKGAHDPTDAQRAGVKSEKSSREKQ
jgi:hypothetical protein